MSDNSTDKLLLVALVVGMLIAGVWTREPIILDTFRVTAVAIVVALVSRVERKK